MSSIVDRSHTLFYRFGYAVVWLLFHTVFRLRVIGRENIPRHGPLVIASNHIHNMDPILIGFVTPRFVRFMAKEELFRWRPLRWLIQYFGAFPVKRGQNDRAALKQALAVTESGGCLVVFPEGHRSRTGKLLKGQPGVAFIARKSNCPIVPVAIRGPYRVFGTLTVVVGEPFLPTAEDTNESVLDSVMQRIGHLLEAGTAQ